MTGWGRARNDCAADPRLDLIDVMPAVLGARDDARRDIFERDSIHLDEEGHGS
jgi:hypothetical protein